MEALAFTLSGLILGAAVALLAYKWIMFNRVESAEVRAAKLVADAEVEAQRRASQSLLAAKDEIAAMRREAEEEVRNRLEDARRAEEELARNRVEFEGKFDVVARRERELERLGRELQQMHTRVEQLTEQRNRELERISRMTSAEARDALIASVVEEAKRDAMVAVREIEQQAREEGERRARKIVTIAIQRVASEQTAESSVSVFPLPSEDMKGRIIGREGRNIRAFEAITGVNLIIDDTPEAVVLSCFDPVRREVGRLTLEKLVSDGRIQPVRIEEAYSRSVSEVDDQIKRAGQDALTEVGITDVHPEMVRLLGRLQYRTSYGQNVLKHLVEAAHIGGAIAAELGVDVRLVKRCALMHDIGKAVTHEVEGSHALIGAELARRLREPPEVVHAIESHHGEVEPRTVEAVLAQTADQISGSRPGARRESLETYVKRLERLEEIAMSYPGVEKTFALQAGREVRVMVKPQEIDDLAAQVLARDIAKRVEEELQYPGQIRITVVRESRAVEYAK